MHIEIEQSTQQVASNAERGWQPEEIDLILNKMQERFISSCLLPKKDGAGGFEISQQHADYIRMLVTRKDLVPYLSADGYECFLPGDYRNLLADGSSTKSMCGAALPAAVNETLFITTQKQYPTEKEAAPFYETMSLQMPGLVLDLDTLANEVIDNYTGLTEVKDWTFLTPWLLHHGNRQRNLYWENFNNTRYPGQFITVDTTEPEDAIGITIDGDDHMDGTTTTVVKQKHTGTGTTSVNNRLSPSDIIPALNQSHYQKTSFFSPITELRGTNLVIYANDSFIVTGVSILYIRKPRPISLSLSSDCELAGEKTHHIICDLATEYIKMTLQNTEGRNLKAADIAERVTI